MRLLYLGQMYPGSTALQRAQAFAQLPELNTVILDTGARVGMEWTLWERVRNKLKFPVDRLGENAMVLAAVARERPDVVFVDNSKVLRRETLGQIRKMGVRCLAYYTPDDILSRYNLSVPLRRSFGEWDVVFTTKSFHLKEMPRYGVRQPVLIGNAFDPTLHRPMTRTEVCEEFEGFDFVFVGAHEDSRRKSVNRLAEKGYTVVVYGGTPGGWTGRALHPGVSLRGPQFGLSYTRCLHHGKVALGFLRKISRDRITTRSIEIAAAGRPMLAEKTDEHDAHFRDGAEYFGFCDNDDLVEKARFLLAEPATREKVGQAARMRALGSGYSVLDRAHEMMNTLTRLVGEPGIASRG